MSKPENKKKKKECYFNKGEDNTSVAFVFSCPGKKEEAEKRPVSGKTGENLEILLHILSEDKHVKAYFPWNDRYKYRITNANTNIYFMKKNSKTEPNDKEVVAEENIKRLKCELKGFSIIIAFGLKSQIACKKAVISYKKKPKVINVYHLSYSGINHIPINKEDFPKAKDRTDERLRIIAEAIKDKINNQKFKNPS